MPNFGITEGLIIASVPAAAYLYSFSFELGRLRYFDMPLDLIDVNTVAAILHAYQMIPILAITLGVLFLFWMLWILVALLFPKSRIAIPVDYWNHQVDLAIGGYCVAVMLVHGFDLWREGLRVVAPPLLIFVIGPFVFRGLAPMIGRRIEIAASSFKDPVAVRDSSEGILRQVDASGPVLLLVCVLIFGSLLSVRIGHLSAQRQTKWLVVDSRPDLIVVRAPGDSAICARIDRRERKTTGAYQVISKSSGLSFHWEELGHLKEASEGR